MLKPKRVEIRNRRLSLNLSMNKLSHIAGLSSCSIYRIENGIGEYTHPIRAKAIAKALKCKLSDIFEEV